MARSFLTAINLNKNELQNAAVQNLGTAPSSPVKGQIYYDSTGNILYWWNGTAWVSAVGGASSFPGYGPVPAETTFGITKNDGVATTVARSDHTHGSPLHDNAAHSAVNLNALAAPTGNINMANFAITNLGPPSSGTDATNKTYVDNAIAGLAWKDPVRLASTANVALSGLTAMDGVTPLGGDRILLKNQTSAIENGIYVATAGAWTRATDADAGPEIEGMAVFVMEGTTNADTSWVCTTNAPITPGSTALAFVQFSGGGTVTAGAGMTQSGNTLNVIGDATMVVTADQISQAPLTGDVTTSAGSVATTIANNAVTNAKLADMAGLTVKGNSSGSAGDPNDLTLSQLTTMLVTIAYPRASRVYSTTVGGSTAQTITHNLGVRQVTTEVYRNSAPYDTVDCDVERVDGNNVTLRFAVAPAASEYNVVIVG